MLPPELIFGLVFLTTLSLGVVVVAIVRFPRELRVRFRFAFVNFEIHGRG